MVYDYAGARSFFLLHLELHLLELQYTGRQSTGKF
jgi:hypothetical protein